MHTTVVHSHTGMLQLETRWQVNATRFNTNYHTRARARSSRHGTTSTTTTTTTALCSQAHASSSSKATLWLAQFMYAHTCATSGAASIFSARVASCVCERMRCLVPAARAPLSSTRRCGLLGQNGNRDFVRFVVVGRARMCVIIRTRTSLICNTLFAQFLDGQRESEYEYNTTHGDRKAGDIVFTLPGGGDIRAICVRAWQPRWRTSADVHRVHGSHKLVCCACAVSTTQLCGRTRFVRKNLLKCQQES